MSLRVNLLKPEERSNPIASVIRTAIVSLGFLLAATCAFYITFSYLALASSKLELSRAKRRNESLGDNVKMAVSLEKQLSLLRERYAELNSFSNAAFRASEHLYAVAESVPAKIQLISLDIDSNVVSKDDKNERYGRRYKGNISGRLATATADGLVTSMIETMEEARDHVLGKVTPGGLNVDPSDPSVLMFDIRMDMGFLDCGSLKPSSATIKGGAAR